MTMRNDVRDALLKQQKLDAQAERLRARLEKLADSDDPKIASAATSNLTTILAAELAAKTKEDSILPLRAEIVELKRAAKAAEEALSPVTAERDALLVEVSGLREQAEKSGPLQAQLDAMIAENAAWKAAQHELLVAENQRYCWDAERARNDANEKLKSAQRQFSTTGLEALLAEMRRLVEVHNIPQPDIWALPENVSPLLLELWGWPRIKAQIFVALTRGYPEPTESFRQLLIRCLAAALPIYEGRPPDPVENLSTKLEVLRMMASRWPGVWESAQRQVDQVQVQRQALAMQNNVMSLAAQQQDLARMGYGREPIAVQESASSIPLSEHVLGCCCKHCGGTGRPSDLWSGEIPADPALPRLAATTKDEEER